MIFGFRSSSAVFLIAIGSLLLMQRSVHADFTFGSGANEFTITTVTVGNAGNSADIATTYNNIGSQTPGSVSYSYEVMKYEVTRGMVFKFNNQNDASSGSRDITLDLNFTPDPQYEDTFNPYRFNTPGDASSGVRDTLPASGISGAEAAQFVNWLNAEKGYAAAYNLDMNNDSSDWTTWSVAEWDSGDTGYLASQPYRNSEARFFLMNFDEAYKAAFYDSSTDSYFDYATGSNTLPRVYGQFYDPAPPTIPYQGTLSDSVVKLGNAKAIAEADQAGGVSPYGVMGITGSIGDLLEFTSLASLGSFGGSFHNGSTADLYAHNAALYYNVSTNTEFYSSGFRVIYADLSSSSGGSSSPTVPEPGTAMALGLLGIVGFANHRRRRRVRSL